MLNGMSMQRAELFGKPNIATPNCCICGKPASNMHHVVPKGIGGGSKSATINWGFQSYKVYSPLFAVCGCGNTSGCHAKFHAGKIKVEWIWDDEKHFSEWWHGDLPAIAGNEKLFDYGCYHIFGDGIDIHYPGGWSK